MKKNKLIIATRRSPLALWQSHWIGAQLPVPYELLPLSTQGDENLAQSLSTIGGKGLFVTALEQALLDGRADIAVHSMKDVPVELASGCELAAIGRRGSVHDAFVSRQYTSLDAMPVGACIGTASARRKALLHHYYPHLQVIDVRGNVQTRLEKSDSSVYDGLILAAAGLERLNLTPRIQQYLNPIQWMPAPGQGAIGVECLSQASEVKELLLGLHDENTADCVRAERSVSAALGGSCVLPLAAHAYLEDEMLVLSAWLNHPQHTVTVRGFRHDAVQLGIDVAREVCA